MGRVLHLLVDTVTVAAVTGVGNTGDPTFGAQSTLPARVENKSRLIPGTDGNDLKANHVIITETEIDRRSKVWLPGDSTGDANAARRILDVRKSSTPDSFTLYETYL